MMPLCKAITKQLLGARYEGAARALAAVGVLYLAALLGAAGLAVPLAGHTGVVLGLALAVTAASLAALRAALLWLTGRQKN